MWPLYGVASPSSNTRPITPRVHVSFLFFFSRQWVPRYRNPFLTRGLCPCPPFFISSRVCRSPFFCFCSRKSSEVTPFPTRTGFLSPDAQRSPPSEVFPFFSGKDLRTIARPLGDRPANLSSQWQRLLSGSNSSKVGGSQPPFHLHSRLVQSLLPPTSPPQRLRPLRRVHHFDLRPSVRSVLFLLTATLRTHRPPCTAPYHTTDGIPPPRKLLPLIVYPPANPCSLEWEQIHPGGSPRRHSLLPDIADPLLAAFPQLASSLIEDPSFHCSAQKMVFPPGRCFTPFPPFPVTHPPSPRTPPFGWRTYSLPHRRFFFFARRWTSTFFPPVPPPIQISVVKYVPPPAPRHKTRLTDPRPRSLVLLSFQRTQRRLIELTRLFSAPPPLPAKTPPLRCTRRVPSGSLSFLREMTLSRPYRVPFSRCFLVGTSRTMRAGVDQPVV